MTRKDFELIAQCIRNVRGDDSLNAAGQQITCDALALEFSRQLGWDNPKFNKPKFLGACGVQS